jgi:tetratricopeptide (TPR) repeat protein
MMLGQLDNRQLDVVTLPAEAVAVGASWESATAPALSSIPLPMAVKVTSTLAEVRTVDGHKCAVIKSKLTPGDKKTGSDIPEMEVTGDVETLFDADGGFSRSVTCKLAIKMKMGAEGGDIAIETANILDSMKMLPAEDIAREANVIKAFDAAVASLYDGEYDKASDALEALKPADLPGAWKAGINKAIGNVKQFAQMAQGFGEAMDEEEAALDPADRLFAEAEKAKQDQKWADAVAKYKELAEKFPEHTMAPAALLRAAQLYETRLNDKKSADETRQAYAALMQKRLDAAQDKAGDPMQLYKLGASFAEGGEPEKAIDAYRKFLAVESSKVPANMRLLAQYRVGGLLEKQGKTAEAAEAYNAVTTIPGDDDYSTKLKEQARKKAEALGAKTPK